MINHNIAIEILKNNIRDIQEKITCLKNKNTFEFTKEAEAIELQRIDNLQGTIVTLLMFINEPLKIHNNQLRLKIIKKSNEIKINTITKEGKDYAIVPIEILPKLISF